MFASCGQWPHAADVVHFWTQGPLVSSRSHAFRSAKNFLREAENTRLEKHTESLFTSFESEKSAEKVKKDIKMAFLTMYVHIPLFSKVRVAHFSNEGVRVSLFHDHRFNLSLHHNNESVHLVFWEMEITRDLG